MSLKRFGDWDKVPNMGREVIQRIEQAIVFRLHIIGTESVNHARDNNTGGSYTDQTGNLRNSVGYALVKDGRIIEYAFKNENEITDEKRFFANEKIRELLAGEKGYSLIIVAGMDYAAAVESKGYNVLTSTERYTQSEMKTHIGRILSEAGFKS